MALNDINKDELQDFADAVDVDKSGNKPEIVQRLENEGYTEEDVKSFQAGTFNPDADEKVETTVQTADDEPVTGDDPDESEEAQERVETVVDQSASETDLEEENARVQEATGLRETEDEDDEEEKVLLKLVGRLGSVQTAGVTFTNEHPYVAVPRDVAEGLLKSPSFRQAHPSEAEEYYS